MKLVTSRLRSLGLLALLFAPCLAAQDANHQPGSEASARAFLKSFLDPAADHARLSAGLRPTKADYGAIFTADAAAKLLAAYDPAWQQGGMVLKGKPGQTELLLWSATTDDIRAWRSPTTERFPGGYKGIGAHLKPGHTIYVFKFVVPGESLGMQFDGLVYINGNWRLIPKPWRVLE